MRTTGRQTFVMLGPMLAFAAAVPLAQGARNTVASKSAPKAAATRDVPTDVPTTLQAAADALGMLRFINRVDTLGTMEFFAKGTTAALGPTDYYGSLSYLEPAMRVVMTSIPATSLARGGDTPGGRGAAAQAATAPPGGTARGRSTASAAPKVQVEVVNGKVAWNESELGAGLVPGKGVATPSMAAVKERQLLLWTLPFGVVKAAVKAGDRTKLSKENGTTILAFPFSDELDGVTARVTLDPKSYVSKVETRASDPAMANLNTNTTYSGYREFDIDLATTNVFFPAHIVRTQGGRVVLDLRVTNTDTNNPYEVFVVPDGVR